MTTQTSLKLSVIIPVYNNPEGLEETLGSMINQDFPNSEYEIIVVDNCSQDDTWETAQRYQKIYPQLIKIFQEKSIQSAYAARNKGIQMSSGDVLAFIDADMTAESHWLKDGLKDMEKRKSDYMFFRIENYSKDRKEKLISKYTRMKEFPQEDYFTKLKFGTVGSLFVRREIFDTFGCFNRNLISGGDREFGNRLYEQGIIIDFNSRITLHHPTRRTFKSVIQKSFRVGRGVAQLQKFYPERYGSLVKGLLEQEKRIFILPSQMAHIFRQWDKLSVREKISFSILCFITKVIGYIGQLWEKYF